MLARYLRSRSGAIDPDALATAFADWAQDAADVGNQTRQELDAVRRGASWRQATAQLSPEAAGNGSLMRVAHRGPRRPNDSCLDACSGFARLLWRTVETGELRFDTVHEYLAVAEVRQAANASLQDGAPAISGWVLHTLCGALWAVRGAMAGALAGARWGMRTGVATSDD